MSTLDQTLQRIEAIVFAHGEPIECRHLAEVLSVEEETIHKLVLKLKDKYRASDSAIDILVLDNAYQMSTLPEYSEHVRLALELGKSTELSTAAMEVLAIIAYNQPVTRSFVEEVRGVDCSSLVRGLAEKDLIEEAGRLNIPGRPIIYKTTPVFLRSFSLDSIEQLPTLPSLPPEDEDTQQQVEGQIDFFEDPHKDL